MMVRTSLVARWLALIATAFAATGCANNSPAPLAPATLATVESAIPLATANPTRVATLASPTRSPITTTGAITLTLWTTEDLAPGTSAGGRILRNQFDAFTAAYPNIHIDITLKKAYGKGGLLDFLTTTSAVVPDQLPDLAMLDISEVPSAAAAGILQPLDPIINADVKGDFFPFAYQAAMYQGKWVAVPFTADVEHLVYNRTVVKKVPQTWDDLLKQKSPLLLAAGGDTAFLAQYLAIAPLFDANNQFAIDVTASAQVLNFFKRAHDLGLVPDTAVGLKSSEEAWPTFVAGKVAMVQVSASRYLADRDKVPDAQYALVPTRDGRSGGLATGWSLVVVAKDPTREVAAARFIQWIVQGEHLAPWLRSARRLPASRSTLILSVDPVEYATFLRDPLEHASFVPPSAAYGKVSEAWRAAMTAVWKGQTTPDDAARSIANVLK